MTTNRFWSELARGLSPYVPGEQPKIPGLVKLNTNESPLGLSPKAIEAPRTADFLRITVGSETELDRLEQVLNEILTGR